MQDINGGFNLFILRGETDIDTTDEVISVNPRLGWNYSPHCSHTI